jgi:hypothetical protein
VTRSDHHCFLDCHDVDTAATSLAAILGVPVDRLLWSLRECDAISADARLEDPAVTRPQQVLRALESNFTEADPSGAYFFHGTRVIDPTSFTRVGLVPLDERLEQIWDDLYTLVKADLSPAEWKSFRDSVECGGGGHDGSLYRMKTRERLHFGPHAELLREIHLDPPAGVHSYLGCPEIVQDIARCLQSHADIDLESRFCSATEPYIVKFRSRGLPRGAVDTAINYVAAALRGDGPPAHTGGGYVGRGRGVDPGDVTDVELVRR